MSVKELAADSVLVRKKKGNMLFLFQKNIIQD